MSSFTTPLVVSLMPDGRRWRLERSFIYRIGSKYSNVFIRVAARFLTDFASIPKIVFWLLPWWAKFNKASVLHDWLYRMKQVMSRPVTRKEADDMWLEAMLIDFRHHRSGKIVAWLEYWAVRWFGWKAWNG